MGVGAVDPLYRQLQGLAAPHRAHGRARAQRALRLAARVGEQLVAREVFEEGEVHGLYASGVPK